ncbi:putative peptidase S1 family protein [Monocercomonoides exilis]|uniref:putative peptidase S1 family protein n=1 Tax=Monocercomonoides exilis TaxID=2049356 RepID=UPI0035597395|nr:putative peptidase S1 family protein [Monocercomonoides exilis]|eukprot:MONOS_1022.1-p1 / transcript=MONOS_1022.1 / gene=MONOS_1022 / organism=Monocercomonoides_exilis_PA203 / gene_product=peptidase S1 family protein / transcript_product=peptidase S1 family protein / location=Mono_scaffold00017:82752-84296(+) / protein_length=258 / sequence_SO=supercontig / SO=protein_coding / is_pseudo=false
MLVSSRGVCTGTLVGEDIVLTASHCIPWNDDGSIDRIRFLPGFYKKHAPFGYADVKTVYSLTRNGGKINAVQAAFDVSCLKISKKLGKKAGYAGTVQWKREWEERSDWFNVGYPQPEHGFDEGITPLIQEQGNVTFVKEYTIGSLTSYLMKTTFDLTRGHSGGPIFGFFDGEEYPRVAAVVSSENPASKSNPHGRNNLSGGESLSFIVGYARSVSEAENNKEELNAPIDHENMQRNNPKINEKEISNVTLIFKNGKDH